MFDFFDKIKKQTNNITNNIKTHSLKLNLNNIKNPFAKHDYKSVSQGEEMSYLSPRAYETNSWPVVDNDWLPYVPKGIDNSIVDRFVRVITINDDTDNVRLFLMLLYEVLIVFFFLQRRTDREEIRRRLAMGSEDDYYSGNDRPGRKPSLQARLQSGNFLDI